MKTPTEPNAVHALGYRIGDTCGLSPYCMTKAIRAISDQYGFGAEVVGQTSRIRTLDWLSKNCETVPDTNIKVMTGIDEDASSGRQDPWVMSPAYRGGKLRVFLCSTVTRENVGDCPRLYDGADFAKAILVGTPSVVACFQNEYRGDASLPDQQTMESDFEGGVLYVPRDMRTEKSQQISSAAMQGVVKGLWENGPDMLIATYFDIVTKAAQQLKE